MLHDSFKVAEQPSELKVHTSGLSASALVFYLSCSDVPNIIIMNRSWNKHTYRLYFNFTCKFNFQVIITGNSIASNLVVDIACMHIGNWYTTFFSYFILHWSWQVYHNLVTPENTIFRVFQWRFATKSTVISAEKN